MENSLNYLITLTRKKEDYRNSLEGTFTTYIKRYEKYGLIASEDGIRYKEWAPAAKEVYLTGDFNGWNRR